MGIWHPLGLSHTQIVISTSKWVWLFQEQWAQKGKELKEMHFFPSSFLSSSLPSSLPFSFLSFLFFTHWFSRCVLWQMLCWAVDVMGNLPLLGERIGLFSSTLPAPKPLSLCLCKEGCWLYCRRKLLKASLGLLKRVWFLWEWLCANTNR